MKFSLSYIWRILSLYFFATTINYIDRLVIDILAPYISEELGLSGFGIIRFNLSKRGITAEAYRFLSKTAQGEFLQFPGWPLIIHQLDNYGREPAAHLPSLDIQGMEDPLIKVTNEVTGELEYILRIKGNSFKPMVFSPDPYTVRISDPDKDVWETFKGLKPVLKDEESQPGKLKVKF